MPIRVSPSPEYPCDWSAHRAVSYTHLIGDAVLLFQPVLDAWYYGAAFIIIASVLITLINVIRAVDIIDALEIPKQEGEMKKDLEWTDIPTHKAVSYTHLEYAKKMNIYNKVRDTFEVFG